MNAILVIAQLALLTAEPGPPPREIKAVGVQGKVGCGENPKKVDRLEITKPGVYENYLVDCNWGGGNVNVNVNKYNNFNRTDIKNGNWEHKPEHRKGAQYRDQASQKKFGGEQVLGVTRGRPAGRPSTSPRSRGPCPAGAGGAARR